MSTSPSEKKDISRTPGLITKLTDHPFGMVLLGEVVAAHWVGDGIILYYADNHKAKFSIEDGELMIEDHEVPSC
jgi:hypothetical protein